MGDATPMRWLAAISLLATKDTQSRKIPTKKGVVYGYMPAIMKHDEFSLYPCLLPDGRSGIFKIATDASYNSALANEARILNFLRERDTVEENNYRNFIPEVVVHQEVKGQDGRVANFLGFHDQIERFSNLIPLSLLIFGKDGEIPPCRVDARTAVWIWGKFLKIMHHVEEQGVVNRRIDSSNILIEPKLHAVVVFNWMHALLESPSEFAFERERQGDIRKGAKAIISLLGGDPSTGHMRFRDEQLTESQQRWFEDYFVQIISGKTVRFAEDLHSSFYAMAYAIWGQTFYPFKTLSRN